jgi:hypothetical protein
MKILDLRSPVAGEIKILLNEFGVDVGEAIDTLRRLDYAAREGCLLMRDRGDDHDNGLNDDDPRDDERQSQINEEIERIISLHILATSMVMGEGGNRETLKTWLFLKLRDLFMNLGGTNSIGSGGPLYRFVTACTKMIDEEISMPKPETFRINMQRALRRPRKTSVAGPANLPGPHG